MSIDFRKTSHILFFGGFLPALSLGLSWCFNTAFPDMPFWIETVSPLYAYALVYSLFENYFWHWYVFKKLGVVTFPDLRGRWKGTQRSSRKEKGENVILPAYIEIKQKFSKIVVCAYYDKSQSESAVANFAELNGEMYLFYTYDNDPNSLKSGTMETHKGTVKLQYLPAENKLRGMYFNSIGNRGEMMFEFQQKELFYCFNKEKPF